MSDIRIVVTLTEANPELVSEFRDMPVRARAERMRVLATLGLRESRTHDARPTGRESGGRAEDAVQTEPVQKIPAGLQPSAQNPNADLFDKTSDENKPQAVTEPQPASVAKAPEATEPGQAEKSKNPTKPSARLSAFVKSLG